MFKPKIVICAVLLILFSSESFAQESEDSTNKSTEEPEFSPDSEDKPQENPKDKNKPKDTSKPENESNSEANENKSLDSVIDSIIDQIGKYEIGIKGLDSLKRTKCETQSDQFRCSASAPTASITGPYDSAKIDLDLKMMIWGKIRRGRVVKVRMQDAQVDIKSMSEVNMHRPRELRKIGRELRRRYWRLAIATKRVGRKMLPIEVKA